MMTSKDLLFQIKLAMLYKDVLQKDVAEKTGINSRTLQRRFMKPETFRIDELIKISEMLDIKFEFAYVTESNPISISPSITPNTWSGCDGCYIYEQIKRGQYVVNDTCTFCINNPNKITCEAKSNDK